MEYPAFLFTLMCLLNSTGKDTSFLREAYAFSNNKKKEV